MQQSKVHRGFTFHGLRCTLMLVVMAGVLCSVSTVTHAAEVIQRFTLKDHLRFAWQNQLVTFPLDKTAASQVDASSAGNLRLLGPSGQPVAFQYVQSDELTARPSLAFFVDLGALQEVTYQLVRVESGADSGMAATPAPAVTIHEAADEIRMFNANTGLAIATNLQAAMDGPIRKLLLADGQWVGHGVMPKDLTPSSYAATITARGPVFAEIRCTYQFKQGGEWQLHFRLPRHGKVVLIDEQFKDIAKSQNDWKFRFTANEAPTHMIYRVGYDGSNKEATKDALVGANIKTDMGKHGWMLRPWHSWWDHNNGVSFQLMWLPENKTLANLNDEKLRTNDWFIVDQGVTPTEAMKATPQAPTMSKPVTTMLMGAGNPREWASDGQWGQSHRIGLVHLKDNEFELRLPLSEWPSRAWFLGSQLSGQTHFDNNDLTDAHAMVIDYYDRPLDRIKDMVLSWSIQPEHATSNLFPSATEMKALREKGLTFGYDISASRKSIKGYLLNPTPNSKVPEEIRKQLFENPFNDIGGIILSATPTIGTGRNSGINSALHEIGRRVENAAIITDAALGSGILTEEESAVQRARLALMGYGIASGNMVNPERGFRNHPNMTAMMYGGLGMIACALPDHPEARNWASITEKMYLNFLDNWCGPNGSWIEAPHYHLGSINSIIVFGLAAKRSGISDLIFDERIKKTALYLAQISTPPDPTFDNRRHIPAIGNTYLREPTSFFGIMAGIYQDKDPAFAANMQWMWEQQGKPSLFVIGGDVTMAWFADFAYADIKPIKPDWTSEFFPSFGAAFHHGYGSEHETYMVYHRGPFNGHYDRDQGSFEMWGKGQPLMLDWGYNGSMPAWLHNTATFASSGEIDHFEGQPWSDLAEASQKQWDRRILFVKDPQPQGPAYYVLQDTVGDLQGVKKPTALWYWFNTTQTPRKVGQMVHVVGPNGVNLDVWIDKAAAESLPMYDAKAWAQQLAKSTEDAASKASGDAVKMNEQSVTAYGGLLNGYWGKQTTTQQGLEIALTPNQVVTTVLFPRVATDKPAVITSIAQGKGLRIVSDAGTDYVFFANEPMDVKVDEVVFKGRVGVVQIRKEAAYFTLHDGESISSGSAKLTQSQGKSLRVAR